MRPALFFYAVRMGREKDNGKDKVARLGFFHHVTDYVVAAAFIFIGVRAQDPVWPLLIGIVALVNAATTRGPLAAYRAIPHSVHMVIDVGVLVTAIVGAVAVRNNASDALGLVALAVLQGFNLYLTRVLKRSKA